MQKAAFCTAKGRERGGKRPCFATQYATFYNTASYVRFYAVRPYAFFAACINVNKSIAPGGY